MIIRSELPKYVVSFQPRKWPWTKVYCRWPERTFYSVQDAIWFKHYMKVIKGRNSYIAEVTEKEVK